MQVQVAGATGVVGRQSVPHLLPRGHQVTATASRCAALRKVGAEAVVLDGLDACSVHDVATQARPDPMAHHLIFIARTHAGPPDVKHMKRGFALTNRLRTGGTDRPVARPRSPSSMVAARENASVLHAYRSDSAR